MHDYNIKYDTKYVLQLCTENSHNGTWIDVYETDSMVKTEAELEKRKRLWDKDKRWYRIIRRQHIEDVMPTYLCNT